MAVSRHSHRHSHPRERPGRAGEGAQGLHGEQGRGVVPVSVGTAVYCCGPEPLLASVEQRCRAWPPGSLHVERFAPRAETPVLDGVPDHRDSLLSEEERAACDTMMICVSRARGRRLVLDL